MAHSFESTPIPNAPEAFLSLVEKSFAELTGHPLSHDQSIYVDRFSHGGMSSGHVCPEFWRDTAVPMLLARHAESVTRSDRVMDILKQVKLLAREYRQITGKPLGVTGEIAEYEAARILNLEICPARQQGYDAIERCGGIARRLQIKGRCLLEGGKPSQMVPSINVRHDFDAVILVLLDHHFEAFAIYEADRESVKVALAAPGSKARNLRGAMAVSKFKSIGKERWSRDRIAPRVESPVEER